MTTRDGREFSPIYRKFLRYTGPVIAGAFFLSLNCIIGQTGVTAVYSDELDKCNKRNIIVTTVTSPAYCHGLEKIGLTDEFLNDFF